MEVKFTSLELSYLRQIRGYADLKQRDAVHAQETAQEAQGLFQQYLAVLSRIHQVDGENLTLLPDWSGFAVQDPPPPAPERKKGGS